MAKKDPKKAAKRKKLIEQVDRSIYEHIVANQKAGGLSVIESYEFVGLNQTAWLRLKNCGGFPSLASIIEMADALNISIDELIGRGAPTVPDTNEKAIPMDLLLKQVDSLTDDQIRLLFDRIVSKRVHFHSGKKA